MRTVEHADLCSPRLSAQNRFLKFNFLFVFKTKSFRMTRESLGQHHHDGRDAQGRDLIAQCLSVSDAAPHKKMIEKKVSLSLTMPRYSHFNVELQ